MSAAGAALIWSPFADPESAEAAANVLLDEGLIACAKILPAIRSIYRWRGERGESAETGMLMKTRADLLSAAIARLEQVHPYEAPAIAGWRCDTAGAITLDWLESELPEPEQDA